MRRALVTGITGQDGSYLTELLLEKGYEVHGLARPASPLAGAPLARLYQDPAIYGRRLFVHLADLSDTASLRRVLLEAAPQEVYHLAAESHVGRSFELPEATCEVTGMGTLRLLEAWRSLPQPPRLFHASSCEIFGQPAQAPQDERTPVAPVSPYGCAKAFATHLVAVYRAAFGLFAANGILFNHESPRRGENFVTQKICRGAAAIKLGLEGELVLGDVNGERDWGDARDFVRGMWLMLQQEQPADFVLATGQLHRVQEVVELAFGTVGLDWRPYVKHDQRLLRPAEPKRLVGNANKARSQLGWEPQFTFAETIREMTTAALTRLTG